MWYRKKDILKLILVSEPTLERMVARKEFPKPVRLSRGVAHWFTPEVHDWLKGRLGHRAGYLEDLDAPLDTDMQTLDQDFRNAVIDYVLLGGD